MLDQRDAALELAPRPHHKSPCCAVEDLEVRTSCFIEDLVDVIRRPPKLDRKGDGYALRLQLVRVVLY